MNSLRLISWPYIRRHLLRTTLTATGVVLGVAVFVGTHSANQSVLLAFSQTIDRIAGKTDLQITAGEPGFGEELLEKVQSSPLVRVAVPIIEVVVDAERNGTILVLGVDMTGDRSLRQYDMEGSEDLAIEDPLIFLAQPDSVLIPRGFADRNSLSVGSQLTLGTSDGDKRFTVRGIMKSSHLADAFGGNLVVMDIYAAQHMFGRGRTFDRIDLALKPGVTLDAGANQLRRLVGPAFEVQAPSTRGKQAEALLAGYSLMMDISSAFALFIGMFIVYNSFAIAVAQRRYEIGVLRALGATRRYVAGIFLAESALVGLIGASAGAAFGAALAKLAASSVSRVAGDVYGVTQGTADAAADPMLIVLAIALGTLTSVVSAIGPARNAARVDATLALKKSSWLIMTHMESSVRIVSSVALAAFGVLATVWADSRILFFAGYALVIAAAVVSVVPLSLNVARLLREVFRRLRPVEGLLAADSLIQAPRRTGTSVAALMLSLALAVAFAGTAQSAYRTMVDWMNTSLNADLYVLPSERIDLSSRRFPSSMAEEIASVPGVSRVQRFRKGRITVGGAPVMLVALEMRSIAETNLRKPIAGNREQMYRLASDGQGLIVSDSLAQLRHIRLGDTIDLPAPRGMLSLPVVGITVDYTDQQGTIMLDRSVFIRHWGDDTVSDFRVFLRDPSRTEEVHQKIVALFAGRHRVFVLTNAAGRKYILSLVNQWFSLMNVQIAIAVLVAILGIVNTLTVSINDRRRELAVLQAIGALRAQVRQTIWLEAVAIGAIGLVLGTLLGGVNLYYMLEIVSRDVAGLRLDYIFPTTAVVALIAIILATAFVASLWPAESAVRSSLVEALEYE